MKIGFVLDDSLDKTDGVQQYILTLGEWYVSQGHEVHYLVGETVRPEAVGGKVHSLSKNIKVRFNGNRMSVPRPGGSAHIKRCLDKLQLDVLHVQMPFSPFMAGKVIANAPRTTAVVATFHIAPYSHLVTVSNRLLAILVRRAVKRADKIVSVSSAAASFAKKCYGIETEILPNVVDQSRFISAAKNHEHPPKRIVFLGRLVPRKGCQTLLEAVKLLSQKDQLANWVVDIGGPGPLEPELRKYVARQKLDNVVTFSGFIAEENKADFLANAQIAVFPSRGGESFGIVLIEAMASQNPIVLAGDNPGYRSVLESHTDQLFRATDSVELADKIEAMMTDPLAAADARQWQQEEVKQYDVSVVGAKLIDIYEQALQRRRTVR